MARKAGKDVVLRQGANDLSQYVADVRFDRDVASLEVTGGGDSSRKYIPGLKGATMSVTFVWDDSVAAGSLNAVIEGAYGTEVAWEYGPGGSATGQRKFTFNGFVSRVGVPLSVDGRVEMPVDIQISGDVTVTTY